MILLDVNVLVYAHRPEVQLHAAAYGWLLKALNDAEPIAVWDGVLTAAYRVLTNPKVVRDADAAGPALEFLTKVRNASVVINPGRSYWTTLSKLLLDSGAIGNLVTDASIAAVAIENDCRLATFDRDFARFTGLQWFEPSR